MATVEKSRSDMIREFLISAKKPSEKGAAFICEALKAKGITVSKQLVYQVKTAMRKKRRSASAKNAAVSKNRKASDVSSLLIAKNLQIVASLIK